MALVSVPVRSSTGGRSSVTVSAGELVSGFSAGASPLSVVSPPQAHRPRAITSARVKASIFFMVVSSFHFLFVKKTMDPKQIHGKQTQIRGSRPFGCPMIALHRFDNGSPADLLCRPRAPLRQEPEKPFGGAPFRFPGCLPEVLMSAAPLSLFFIIRDKTSPCQGSRRNKIRPGFSPIFGQFRTVSRLCPGKGLPPPGKAPVHSIFFLPSW